MSPVDGASGTSFPSQANVASLKRCCGGLHFQWRGAGLLVKTTVSKTTVRKGNVEVVLSLLQKERKKVVQMR